MARRDDDRRRGAAAGVRSGSAAGGAMDALTLAVRVKPGAARARVGGGYDGPYGVALVVAVNAPAVEGRATEAARRAVAEALGVRASAVSLRTGAASRDKLFSVDVTAAGVTAPDLRRRLADLRDGAS